MATSKLKITVGEHNLGSTTETTLTKDFSVEKIEVHKTSAGVASAVDLALIKVTADIDLTVYTPICLPEAGRRKTSSP